MKSVECTRSLAFRSFSCAPRLRAVLSPATSSPRPALSMKRDLGQVQQDLPPALGQQLVDGVAQDLVAQARGELALEVDDDDVAGACRISTCMVSSLARAAQGVRPPLAPGSACAPPACRRGRAASRRSSAREAVRAAFSFSKAAGSNAFFSSTRTTA